MALFSWLSRCQITETKWKLLDRYEITFVFNNRCKLILFTIDALCIHRSEYIIHQPVGDESASWAFEAEILSEIHHVYSTSHNRSACISWKIRIKTDGNFVSLKSYLSFSTFVTYMASCIEFCNGGHDLFLFLTDDCRSSRVHRWRWPSESF